MWRVIAMPIFIGIQISITQVSSFQIIQSPIKSKLLVLYAKKTSKSKASRATSNKGFGTAPLTVEEFAATLPTRIPKTGNLAELPCPCGSRGLAYADCCQPYHNGEKWPEAPINVLYSRYSAFCYRLPLYVMETTHPACSDYREDRMEWLKDLHKSGMFDSYDFVALEPGQEEASSDNKNEAYVSFVFRVKPKSTLQQKSGSSNTQTNNEVAIREKSRFIRDDKGWRYAGGDVSKV